MKKTTSTAGLKKTEAVVKKETKPKAAKAAKKVLESDDDDEIKIDEPKPVLKESTNSTSTLLKMFKKQEAKQKAPAPAPTKTAPKKTASKKDDDDSMDEFVVSSGESDASFQDSKPKAASKKKLLDRVDSPAKRAKRAVAPKNQCFTDADLFGDSD